MKNNFLDELDTLNREVKELTSIYRNIAKEHNISDSEFYCLYTLITMEGEFTQKDLCEMWFLPKQTVNSGVNSLLKKNYISIENSSEQSKKVIKLTEKGREYSSEFIGEIFKIEQQAFLSIPESTRTACLISLKSYINSLKVFLDDLNK